MRVMADIVLGIDRLYVLVTTASGSSVLVDVGVRGVRSSAQGIVFFLALRFATSSFFSRTLNSCFLVGQEGQAIGGDRTWAKAGSAQCCSREAQWMIKCALAAGV